MAPQRRLAHIRQVLGLLTLFSGVALLLNILGNIDLRLAFASTTLVMLGAAAFVLRGQTPEDRRRILRSLGIGAASGVVATVAYDVTKATFGVLDPSPFDPFHAIAVFGQNLAGADAGATPILIAGWGFHLLNGTAFGVGYTMLFAREGATSVRFALLSGLAWGIFLESFQLALYPGWLNINSIGEFAASSLLGHMVYGLSLGAVSRTLLRQGLGPRLRPEADRTA